MFFPIFIAFSGNHFRRGGAKWYTTLYHFAKMGVLSEGERSSAATALEVHPHGHLLMQMKEPIPPPSAKRNYRQALAPCTRA